LIRNSSRFARSERGGEHHVIGRIGCDRGRDDRRDDDREDFTCDLLFQSRLNVGGMNLVLFPDVLTGSDSLSVFDPGQSLPKNQDSWE